MNSSSKFDVSIALAYLRAIFSFWIEDVSKTSEAYYGGLEGRLNLFGHQLLPVNVSGKEGMILDILCAIHAQPPRRVSIEQECQYGTRFRSHVIGEPKGILQDLAVHFVGILVVEWR